MDVQSQMKVSTLVHLKRQAVAAAVWSEVGIEGLEVWFGTLFWWFARKIALFFVMFVICSLPLLSF